MRTRSWFVCLGLVTGSWCSEGCAPPVSPAAYLLLDRDAREAGYEVELEGWRGAPVLPLAVRAGQDVELRGGGRSLARLHPADGRLTWLRGERARADEVEVELDRLRIDGTEAAIAELAQLLDARVSDRTDRGLGLEADALYERTSYVEVSAGVREARPEAVAPTVQGRELIEAAPQRPIPSLIELVRSPALAELTGVYVSGDRVMVIDTDGGATLVGCSETGSRGTVERDGDRVLVRAEDGAILRSFVRWDQVLVDGEARFEPLEDRR